jgi:hypothetical protein
MELVVAAREKLHKNTYVDSDTVTDDFSDRACCVIYSSADARNLDASYLSIIRYCPDYHLQHGHKRKK